MEKIFDLLDTAIAVLLVVLAVSMQLYDNHQISLMTRQEQSVVTAKQSNLRYTCNGIELMAHLSLVEEKGQVEIVYGGTKYQYREFLDKILQVKLLPDKREFIIEPKQRLELEKKSFQIYQQDKQWRIEI